MEQFCPWDPANFLISSSNVPTLLYYSHIPAMVIALIIGFTVFYKSGKSRIGGALLIATILFFLWCFFDLILYATNNPSIVMFFWSLQILFEPLIYIISAYFTYLFILKKDTPSYLNFIFFAISIPFVLFLSSKYTLSGVNLSDCTAVEGFIAKYYSFFVEFLSGFFIIGLLIFKIKKILDFNKKKEALMFGLGTLLFLSAFSWGNFIGSFSSNWILAQAGLIGMPIFFGFLAYMVVKFKTFNVKIFATQLLVFVLGFLVIAILFVRNIGDVRYVVMGTLVLYIPFGYQLIKSVKREIKLREEIEQLATQRESFIHFLGHEVKGILGKNKDMFGLLMDKNSGATPEQVDSFLKHSLVDTRSAVDMVENLLRSDDVKNGKIPMDMKSFDMKPAMLEAIESFKLDLETKELSIKTVVDEKEQYIIVGDRENITKHVMRNLIDNAIRYTPKGEIEVSLSKKDGKVLFTVKDNGVGITAEDMSRLFTEGGHGKDSIKTNTHSTGYGLFFAKAIVDAHQGKIWAESEGAGKGTIFFVEIAST